MGTVDASNLKHISAPAQKSVVSSSLHAMLHQVSDALSTRFPSVISRRGNSGPSKCPEIDEQEPPKRPGASSCHSSSLASQRVPVLPGSTVRLGPGEVAAGHDPTNHCHQHHAHRHPPQEHQQKQTQRDQQDRRDDEKCLDNLLCLDPSSVVAASVPLISDLASEWQYSTSSRSKHEPPAMLSRAPDKLGSCENTDPYVHALGHKPGNGAVGMPPRPYRGVPTSAYFASTLAPGSTVDTRRLGCTTDL